MQILQDYLVHVKSLRQNQIASASRPKRNVCFDPFAALIVSLLLESPFLMPQC